jgi:hypothetical protein
MAVQVDMCMAAFYDNSIHVIVSDGKATHFWSDRWIDGQCVVDFTPDLVDAVPSSQAQLCVGAHSSADPCMDEGRARSANGSYLDAVPRFQT